MSSKEVLDKMYLYVDVCAERCLCAGASIKGSPRQRLDEPISNQHGASEGGHRGFQRHRFTMPEPLQRVCSLNNVPF